MKKLLLKIGKTAIATAFALSIHSGAFAQETKDLLDMSLEDLMNMEVTTASKSAQKSGMAPATITVITAEQIKIRGYQGLGEVLEDLPGFNINNNQASEAWNQVQVRGLGDQDKFIILLDGVKVSSPTGEGLAVMQNYPVHCAKQIEVIYGPASALYGADAVTGVINIITQKNDGKQNEIMDASVTGGIQSSVNGTIFYNQNIGENKSLTIGGQYFYNKQAKLYEKYPDEFKGALESLESGVFNSSFGKMTPNAKTNKDFEMPVSTYNINIGLNLDKFTFSYFGNFYRTSSAIGYTGQNAVYNKDQFFGQYLNVFSASYSDNYSDKIVGTTALSMSRYDMDPESNYRNIYVALEPGYKYAFGSMLKAEQQLIYNWTEDLTITGGALFESYYSIPKGTDLEAPVNVDEAISGVIRGTIYPLNPQGIVADFYTVRYFNAGGYLQAQYTPSENMSFTLGGRYDYNSRYEGSFNPRLGIVVKPFENTTIKALYGSAFLAASPYIAYQHFGSFTSADSGRTYTSGYWHLPNPNLKPIKAQTMELGIRSYLTKELAVSVNGFYSIYSDLITAVPDAGNTNYYNGKYKGWAVGYIETYINQGKQYNYGGEVMLDYLLRLSETTKITSYASISIVDGYIDTKADNGNDQEIGYIIPLIVKAGADVVIGDLSISPRIIYTGKTRVGSFETYVKGKDDTGKEIIGNTEKRKTIDGYFVLNANIRYKFCDRFSAFANIDNALDSRYYTMSETFTKGWPQMPINIYLGVNVNM